MVIKAREKTKWGREWWVLLLYILRPKKALLAFERRTKGMRE